MRPDDLFSKRGSAVLDAPEGPYASEAEAVRRRSRRTGPEPRPSSGRDFDDDFADGLPDRLESSKTRRGGVRFRFNGRPVRLPKTLWGRIFSAAGVLCFFAVIAAGVIAIRSFFLHDSRFVIETSSSIQSEGNAHVTRAQLLSVFGEDVERNIFNIPLAERRAELEQLPWVEHATVMRLLPNHIRILITERTPVALVRQGTQLGMVDASGVLLYIPADTAADPHYSFPVITGGIGTGDPLSTRAARMQIFQRFMSDLDSTGEAISKKVSEVDLGDPEDVKALLFEGQSDVLVHFGDSDFLDRYRKFEQHLAEWRAQYPRLSSVDMRYDRQVVLNMQPGGDAAGDPANKTALQQIKKPVASTGKKTLAKTAKTETKFSSKVVAKPPTKGGSKPAAKFSSDSSTAWHMTVVKPHTKASAALATKSKSAHASQASPR